MVAFVKVAKDSCYYPYILDAAAVLIQRPERFAKTGVGWILRDISKYDKNFVNEFVEEFLPFFSRESMKNALKYYDSRDKNYFLKELKTIEQSSKKKW